MSKNNKQKANERRQKQKKNKKNKKASVQIVAQIPKGQNIMSGPGSQGLAVFRNLAESLYQAAQRRFALMLKDPLDPNCRGVMYDSGSNMLPFHKRCTFFISGNGSGATTTFTAWIPNPVYMGFGNQVTTAAKGANVVAACTTTTTYMDNTTGLGTSTGISLVCNSFNVVGGGVRYRSIRPTGSVGAVELVTSTYPIVGPGRGNADLSSTTNMSLTTRAQFQVDNFGQDINALDLENLPEVSRMTTFDLMDESQTYKFTPNGPQHQQLLTVNDTPTKVTDSLSFQYNDYGVTSANAGVIDTLRSRPSNFSTNAYGWNAIVSQYSNVGTDTNNIVAVEYEIHLQCSVTPSGNSGSVAPVPVSQITGFTGREAAAMYERSNFMGPYKKVSFDRSVMKVRGNTSKMIDRLMLSDGQY